MKKMEMFTETNQRVRLVPKNHLYVERLHHLLQQVPSEHVIDLQLHHPVLEFIICEQVIENGQGDLTGVLHVLHRLLQPEDIMRSALALQ